MSSVLQINVCRSFSLLPFLVLLLIFGNTDGLNVSGLDFLVLRNSEDILNSVLKRFPPEDDPIYKKKEYVLPRGQNRGLPGNKDPCNPNTFMTAPNVHPLYAREVHHFASGRPWMLGREIFELVVNQGLLPSHKLLEFECGALSAGIWFIRFLAAENYFGIESNSFLFNAGKTYEIPLHSLQKKLPQLVFEKSYDSQNELTQFAGLRFDRILAVSAFHDLNEDGKVHLLKVFASHLSETGVLNVGSFLPLEVSTLNRLGWIVDQASRYHCRWMACDFAWFDLRYHEIQ